MELLDGVEVACFDLFDTLVRIDRQRLPALEWDGTTVRTTIPALHKRIFASRGVDLRELVRALRSMWEEVQAELRAAESAEDERWREVPAVEKYQRLLRRLEVIEENEVAELAELIANTHHEMLVSASLLVDGAQEVLERVRARGVPTALVSNWDHARAGPAMLAQTQLGPLLDHVVISEAVGFRKPHPRIFEEALAASGAAPQAALHVGDMAESDAWGAGRLGFRTVWIDLAEAGWPDRLAPAPALTVASLAELLEHL
jgi:HAD superfamily hydrolase (TIGR01509 family)